MIFSYEEYYRGTFQFPIYQAIGSFLFLILVIVYYIFLHRNFRMTRFLVLTFVIFFYMLSISIRQLQYGIKLNRDTPDITLEISGEIDDIRDVFLSPRYYYLGAAVHAKIILIDGAEYYFMSSGDLSIGDRVSIVSLPNSLFVLECEVSS